MLPPRKTNSLLFAVFALLQSSSAFCSLSGLSVGATLPQPLSTPGTYLNRPVGITAEGWIETPSFVSPFIDFNLAVEYLPFAMQNVSGSNSVQVNINMLGMYAGLTLWGGPSVLGIRPMISANLGALYDFMAIPGNAATATNSGTAFALRLEPGFDLPLFSHLGLFVAFPMTAVLQKPTLAIWESSFSLRWKL